MRTIKAYTERDIDLISNDMFKLVSKKYPNMDTIQLAAFIAFTGCHILYLATNEKEITAIAAKCYRLLNTPPDSLHKKDEISIEKEGESA